MTNTVLDAAKRLGLALPTKKVIKGVEVDSRKVEAGQLFFALKGKKVDGHDHIAEAAAKGASAAIVSQEYRGESFGLSLIAVPDVLLTLQNLAKEAFLEKKWRVVAVTGSVGKTTTKEFLATLLEAKFRVIKTPGSANSQIGLPMSILNMEKEGELFVMEAGMSAPKELEKLVQIAPPEIALITRIGLAHAAYFVDGLEGIARAKAEIFSHPDTKVGFVNVQCKAFDSVMHAGKSEKRTFGFEKLTQESADYLKK
jgi:UDP-N-acetylmuramoyl-tripeptide--D-alanyl-D-alanine ligase